MAEEPSREVAPPAAALRRLVVWGPDGAPVVKTERVLSKPQIHDLIAASASLPYMPTPEEELLGIYHGMTNLEVMVVKQHHWAARSGDTAEVEAILDRLVGKPKQSSEVLKITKTYDEALREIAENERRKQSGVPKIVEAELVDPAEPDIFS